VVLPVRGAPVIGPVPVRRLTSTRVQAIDTDTGTALGELVLPAAGFRGMLQIGALRRTKTGWTLQTQPEAMNVDLAGLATAAGVDIA
jgi:hypothetical protein